VVPCFRCTFLLHMPPSMTAGSSSAALAQFLHRCLWPSPRVHWLGTPKIPIIRFRWGDGFAASLVRCSLRPVELLAPLTDLTGHFAQPTGTFTPELPASRSPFSSSGITTVATERFHRWDFHPLERQLASLHGLFHPLQHAGLSRRSPSCRQTTNRVLRICRCECNRDLSTVAASWSVILREMF